MFWSSEVNDVFDKYWNLICDLQKQVKDLQYLVSKLEKQIKEIKSSQQAQTTMQTNNSTQTNNPAQTNGPQQTIQESSLEKTILAAAYLLSLQENEEPFVEEYFDIVKEKFGLK